MSMSGRPMSAVVGVESNVFTTSSSPRLPRAAQIAKPTLYGYFPDKEAVFAALVQTLAGDLRHAVDAALAGPGDVISRIAEALAAKYGVIARLLEGSPHAEELYSEHDRTGATEFAAIDAAIRGSIAAALAKAGVKEPEALVELLVGATYGLARKTHSQADLASAIQLLTQRLVEPELPRRGRKTSTAA